MLLKLFISSYSGLSKPIWSLALVSLINRAGSMVLPFMSLYLINALDFTIVQAGIVMTSFGAGSLIGNYLGGYFTDRYGTYWVQVASLFFGGLMYISLIFFESFEMVCLMFALTSMINDMFRPASMASIALYSKPANRTRSIGLIRLAINLGFSAGPAVGGLIIAFTGYKWLFVLDGITCLLACLYFIMKIENRDGQLKKTDQNLKPKVASAIKDISFLFFLFLVILTGIVFMQLFYTIPLYLEQEVLLTPRKIGLLMSLNGLLIAISEMPILHLLEKYKRIIKLMALGSFLMSLSYFALLGASTWLSAIIFFLLITYGEIFNFPYATTWALGRTNENNRGSYMGLYGMGFSISAIVGPYVGTRMVDAYGWDNWWIICGIILVFVTLALLVLEKNSSDRT